MIRLTDIIIAFMLAVFTLPVMAVVCCLIVITSGWPPLYASRRIGKYGREFTHLKFRTMASGTSCGRVFFEQQRITRLGKILRAFHLDELPELFLVLSGSMSLVGPRPLPQQLLAGLDARARTSSAPGLTCLAQISLLRRGRLGKRAQIALDNNYLRRRSAAYNLRILCATFKAMRSGKPSDLSPYASSDRRAFLKQRL